MSHKQPLFDHLIQLFQTGQLHPGQSRFAEGSVTPPAPGDITDVKTLTVERQHRLRMHGEKACQDGQVGALVLAGGMATRFHYHQAKGLFPILGDKTFLELKIQSLKPWRIPLYLMTSFHTHQPIIDFLEQHDYFGYQSQIHLFQQYKVPRIYRDGSVRQVDGNIEYAACGHGDFIDALQESGLLSQFLNQEGRYLLFSNIDNLGATFSPLLLGLHIEANAPMTVEVAAKAIGDKGGAPARVNGQLQLVEEFLFPADFDQNQIPVFNTASYIFSANTLQQTFPLPWYLVEKKVDGKSVLQFEHLAGDLSRFLPIQAVLVERDDRFLPVKQLEDVSKVHPLIARKFAHL